MLSKQIDKKLFVLDAYALIFRAYYAFIKNPRINSKGLNTSAIFGFTNAVLDVIRNEQPTHLAVAFDPPSPPQRTETFSEYKANRDATPEDIKLSVPFILKVLEGMNIPVLMVDGFEADDVIGTLAKQAEKAGFTTYMMTPDKDFGQLVSDNIFMYKPARGGGAAEVWGVPEIREKFGIERVEQVIDILGLMGDAVDNIPGVPGVGPKTATKLIQEYDSIEGIYQHTDELKGKLKENVVNNEEQAMMSKLLATIILDVPIEYEFEDFKLSEPDENILRPLFDELEFRRLADRIFGTSQSSDKAAEAAPQEEGDSQMSLFGGPSSNDAKPQIDQSKVDYQTVDSEKGHSELVQKMLAQKEVCFDTETTSLQVMDAELVGMSFSFAEEQAFWVPLSSNRDEVMKVLDIYRPFFESDTVVKIAHNLKYDFHVLLNYGIEVKAPIYDTMVAHYIINPDTNRRSMDLLADQYLGYQTMSIEKLIGPKGKNQKSMRDADPELLATYAAEDADITYRLKQKLDPELREANGSQVLEQLDLPLIPVLAKMEREGIRLDTDMLAEYSKKLEGEALEIQKNIYEHAGVEFKISSPKQVGEILFDHLKIIDKPKKTKTGQYATGEEVMQDLAGKHPIVDEILNYREVLKLKNTYVDPLPNLINPHTGRLHTSFNQVVAATGRLSSDKPNLQNIPVRTERGRYIRNAFIPRSEDFTLMAADYSQVELRIIASMSGDQAMIDAFNAGEDIHRATAAKVYGVSLDDVSKEMRSNAKTVNFGIIYGISAFGLSQRIGISRTEAKEIIDNYFEQFPGIKTYMDSCIAQAREHGYVETALGRRRYLRDINSRNGGLRGFAERNAINSPIQGTAADLIKSAMIHVQREMEERELKSKMLLQVHDELVFDAHLSEKDELRELVISEMSKAMSLKVPLEVDSNFGSTWLEAH